VSPYRYRVGDLVLEPNGVSSLASGRVRHRAPRDWGTAVSEIEHVLEVAGDSLGGRSGAVRCRILFVGKRASDEYPYQVANERIASEIGRVLGLWIPDSVVYRFNGDVMFFSHFIEDGTGDACGALSPPPSGLEHEVKLLAPATEFIRHGIVMFDLFVANNDRKADNIRLGRDGRLWCVDQGNALFYRPYRADGEYRLPGIARIEAVSDDLSAMFDRPHHYLSWLASWDIVEQWAERIRALPGYLIEHIVDSFPEGVISADERTAVVTFLGERRGSMRRLVESNISRFPGLPRV